MNADTAPHGLSSSLQATQLYVERELAAIGWPKLDLLDHSGVLSCIFSLLKQRSRDLQYRQDLTTRIELLSGENQRFEAAVAMLKSKLDQKEKDWKTATRNLDKATAANSEATKQIASLNSKIKKAAVDLQNVKSLHQVRPLGLFLNDVRKLQSENQKLKETTMRLVAEKTKTNLEFSLANPIPLGFSTDHGADDTHDMYNIVIGDMEAQERELILENAGLRQMLYDVYASVQTKTALASEKPTTIEGAMFHLPLEMMKETLSAQLDSCINDMVLALSQRDGSLELAKELAAMKERVGMGRCVLTAAAEQEKIVQEQTQMLEMALATKNGPDVEPSDDSGVQDQILALKKQQAQLDDDRQKFTDAAIKMGLERAALQRERMALEEEKRAQNMKGVLDTLPPTPAWLKSKLQRGGITPSTGATSPFSKASPSTSASPIRPSGAKTNIPSSLKKPATALPPVTKTEDHAESLEHSTNPFSEEWLTSESPDVTEDVFDDQENAMVSRDMGSEIIIESQTLSTPMSAPLKPVLRHNAAGTTGGKSVRIAGKSEKESLKSAAQTVKLQNSLNALKTTRSPFLPRAGRTESPVATSTPQ
ncbi:hypothetical protein HDV03_005104 [Kappamyces sp. JEL0829]|nr:hypothetical protein HDV03_005104 [Kappamyces sp. JEL0829]